MIFTQPLLNAGVPEEAIGDCMCWALGDGWGSMLCMDAGDVWNQRHRDLFLISGSDDCFETFCKIDKAYLYEHRNRKNSPVHP